MLESLQFNEMRVSAIQILNCFLLFIITRTSSSVIDTLEQGQSLKLGETLTSASGTFELGFFGFRDSRTLYYLGIWYKNISPRTIVWVANRETPLLDSSGALNITSQGVLVITNSANNVIWSTDMSGIVWNNPAAILLESGNLVVVNGSYSNTTGSFLWQSFNFPGDTFLPGMKIGYNFKTGHESSLSSWKSTEDPAPGEYSFHIDHNGYPQLVLRKGSKVQFRMGSWNGQRFTGVPQQMPLPTYKYEFVLNENEVYFEYTVPNKSLLYRYEVNPSGLAQLFSWNERANDWAVFGTTQADQCENYAICGAYSYCDMTDTPICSCFDGFVPKSENAWNSGDWSNGCVQNTPLGCDNNKTDGFLKVSGIKLPDTSSSWYNKNIGLVDCEDYCLKNCSCTGYASLDITDGSGCLTWSSDLTDVRMLSNNGQDLYVRMAASELDKIWRANSSGKKRQKIIIAISVTLGASVLLMIGIALFIRKRNRTKKAQWEAKKHYKMHETYEGGEEQMELPLFDLNTIVNATDNFSIMSKLGEGGFGSVYRGKLIEGQEIAVKRLSECSGQGLNEFKNEVILIAKLQHRNLVRLLGCCIHEDEKMLIYEYMPNKSLDYFLFDQTRSELLDWNKRVHILSGIARGLLYLHEDSRLRIIHRDLKASNILLDGEMNPKISDFGLARIFGADQTEANTNRVVGTYGYMSPEYVVDGHFSIKSDVFSFGVIVLEMLSGRKNRGFTHPDHDLNLLGHAWMKWTEGTPMELIDNCLVESCNQSEAVRYIHIALLCVQQRPEDRPNMATVVLMLGSKNPLPDPKQPGFFTGRNTAEKHTSSSKNDQSHSTNDVTITALEAR